MVDELNHEEDSPENQSGETGSIEAEGPQGDVGQSDDTYDLENLLAQKDEELARANVQIAELEGTVSDRDVDIAALEQSVNEMGEKLASTSDSLVEAVTSYRNMIIQANPDIVVELISGDTVESLNESLEKARRLIGQVRQGLETEIAMARVPTGAPERRSPDLSALSPREKIQYGIGGKK